MSGRAGERGAALLAVLAMVMLLAGFASLGLSRLRAAGDRVSDAEIRSEAMLLADSGTAAALSVIGQLKARARVGSRDFEAPIRLEAGPGSVELRFSEGGACFNLNSLAVPLPAPGRGDAPPPQARPAEFARLLVAAGIPLIEADRLARATAARLAQTRMLWADASEWTDVPGVTAAHWQAAGPLLCALPSREAAAFSVNALTPEKAPLLAALGLRPDEARRVLAARPDGGWTSENQFWAEASASGVPETAGAQVVGTSSRWVEAKLVATTPRARIERTLLLDTVRMPATLAASRWELLEIAPQPEAGA